MSLGTLRWLVPVVMIGGAVVSAVTTLLTLQDIVVLVQDTDRRLKSAFWAFFLFCGFVSWAFFKQHQEIRRLRGRAPLRFAIDSQSQVTLWPHYVGEEPREKRWHLKAQFRLRFENADPGPIPVRGVSLTLWRDRLIGARLESMGDAPVRVQSMEHPTMAVTDAIVIPGRGVREFWFAVVQELPISMTPEAFTPEHFLRLTMSAVGQEEGSQDLSVDWANAVAELQAVTLRVQEGVRF